VVAETIASTHCTYPRRDGQAELAWVVVTYRGGWLVAGLPVTKEPLGLFRSDGKRPDGLTLVPWSSGKALYWDVTVTCPLADSYINAAARQPGEAAELAASRKEEKYADLDGR